MANFKVPVLTTPRAPSHSSSIQASEPRVSPTRRFWVPLATRSLSTPRSLSGLASIYPSYPPLPDIAETCRESGRARWQGPRGNATRHPAQSLRSLRAEPGQGTHTIMWTNSGLSEFRIKCTLLSPSSHPTSCPMQWAQLMSSLPQDWP